MGENTPRMRCAGFLVALFFLACGSAIACDAPSASPAPSPTPQADGAADVTVESDPTTRTKTINLQAAYTGSTYGPGNFEITQIIPRVAAFYVGKSVLRLSLPRVETINGHDSGFSDTALFYLFQRRIRPGAGFVGLSAQFPTADSPSFGTGKWMIGPAGRIRFHRET